MRRMSDCTTQIQGSQSACRARRSGLPDCLHPPSKAKPCRLCSRIVIGWVETAWRCWLASSLLKRKTCRKVACGHGTHYSYGCGSKHGIELASTTLIRRHRKNDKKTPLFHGVNIPKTDPGSLAKGGTQIAHAMHAWGTWGSWAHPSEADEAWAGTTHRHPRVSLPRPCYRLIPRSAPRKRKEGVMARHRDARDPPGRTPPTAASRTPRGPAASRSEVRRRPRGKEKWR